MIPSPGKPLVALIFGIVRYTRGFMINDLKKKKKLKDEDER